MHLARRPRKLCLRGSCQGLPREDARLRPIRLRTFRLRPVGRSRNWPKSKLAEVEINEINCRMLLLSLSLSSFSFRSVSVFVPKNLNCTRNPKPCTPLPMDLSAGPLDNPPPDNPPPDNPKFRAFFCPPPQQFSFFFLSLSLGVFPWNLGSKPTLANQPTLAKPTLAKVKVSDV